MSLYRILAILQVAASAALVLVGSLAEAYGYGLSLGTSWPYRRDILHQAGRADPEAWHRIIATALGVNALLLALLVRSRTAWWGLALCAAAALLGLATLNVLAGRAPAFLHGLHEVLAYLALLAYVSLSAPDRVALGALLLKSAPLHAFLLMVFLGGMVSGQRGFKTAIGPFVAPRTAAQWMFSLHLVGWLVFVVTLARSVSASSAAFLLSLLQVLAGFALYQALNARPGRPGLLAAVHQGTALGIFFSLVFSWQVRLPSL